MKQKTLRSAERRLEEQLLSLGAALRRGQDLMVERSPEQADEAQAEVIESCSIDVSNVTWQLRRQVLDALRRVRRGEYGECGYCHAPIAAKRLEALPWAALCVDCQEHDEAQDWDQAA